MVTTPNRVGLKGNKSNQTKSRVNCLKSGSRPAKPCTSGQKGSRTSHRESPISLKQASINRNKLQFNEKAFDLYNPNTQIKDFIKEFGVQDQKPFSEWTDGVKLPYTRKSYVKEVPPTADEAKFHAICPFAERFRLIVSF